MRIQVTQIKKAFHMKVTYFIRTGIPCNGKYGYEGLNSGGRGHCDKIQQEIHSYAKEIGYLKG